MFAQQLAAAHKLPGATDDETIMDINNNAAGAKIFDDYGESGSYSIWADRVFAALDQYDTYGVYFLI